MSNVKFTSAGDLHPYQQEAELQRQANEIAMKDARIQQLESQLAESRQLFETLRLVAETLEESEKQKAERIAELKVQLATARRLVDILSKECVEHNCEYHHKTPDELLAEATQFLEETQ